MATMLIKNKRALVMLLVLLCVAGAGSYLSLSRAEDPEVARRAGVVLTQLPGADPSRVEATVTSPVAETIRAVDGVRRVDSTSRSGASIVGIQLEERITAPDATWERIRLLLDSLRAELPVGASAPRLMDDVALASTFVVGIHSEDENPDGRVLGEIAEDIEDALLTIPDTDAVRPFGEIDEEVVVEVDRLELAAAGLSIGEVAARVRGAGGSGPSGRLSDDRTEFVVDVEGALDAVTTLRALPLRTGPDGRVLLLGDVAVVRRVVVDRPDMMTVLDGRRGVAIAARMRSGARIDEWVEQVRSVVGRVRDHLPAGCRVQVLFDQSTYTDDRLKELELSFLLGAALVAGGVLLLMGWKSAWLVGLALPLTTLLTLTALWAFGIGVEQISVAGLIIALGLMIDNAIIVVDEVRHRLSEGADAITAARETTRYLAVPLAGSVFTTVLAFLPLILMPGDTGEFVTSLALVVILGLVASTLVALTVLPALTALSGRSARSRGAGLLDRGMSSTSLLRLWRRILDGCMAHPRTAIACALMIPAMGFVAAGDLEEQFFPPASRNQLEVRLRMPASATMEATRDVAERARVIMRRHAQVRGVHWFIGGNAPKFYYNQLVGTDGSPSFAQALVQLKDAEGTGDLARALQTELDEAIPEAHVIVRQLEQGPPVSAPIEVRILGEDHATTGEIGARVRGILAATPGVIHTRSGVGDVAPRLKLKPDEDALRRVGLDANAVALQLQATLDGVVAGSLTRGDETFPVRIRARTERREGISVTDHDLITRAADGSPRTVPLSTVATVEVVPDPVALTRRDGTPSDTVQAWVPAGTLPNLIFDRARAKLEELAASLPAGYRVQFGGVSAERDDAIDKLSASTAILGILMLSVLVVSLGSFRMTGIVVLVAVLSVGPALLALSVCGFPFGFMAIVGTMGLIGIAINDSIVVLAAIKADRRARAGDPWAIREVVVRNTRHVVATTVTTAAGFVPLILAGGGFWPPLAVAVVGGVLAATVTALVLVPVLWMVSCRPIASGAKIARAVEQKAAARRRGIASTCVATHDVRVLRGALSTTTGAPFTYQQV